MRLHICEQNLCPGQDKETAEILQAGFTLDLQKYETAIRRIIMESEAILDKSVDKDV